jgi:hypothetical protein
MNNKIFRSQKSYSDLKGHITHKIKVIQGFLKGGNIALPSGDKYKEIVENFEIIDGDSFKYSIHGRNFLIKTKYHPEAPKPFAQLITNESKDDLKSYPNQILTTINVDIFVDSIGNASINLDNINPSGGIDPIGLHYFNAVANFLYPETVD